MRQYARLDFFEHTSCGKVPPFGLVVMIPASQAGSRGFESLKTFPLFLNLDGSNGPPSDFFDTATFLQFSIFH